MSMIAHLRLVDPAIVSKLAEYDDEEMAEFLFPEDDSSDSTQDLDKAWDVIDHLLAAATDGSLTTLLGGSEVGPDLGYGPARFMTPQEVRAAATVLERLDRVAILSYFNARDLTDAEVYPEIWDDSRELQDYIGQHFDVARSIYLEGARRGSALLVWLA